MSAKKISGTRRIYSVGKGRFGISPGTAYLISGDKNALIETGTSKSVPNILKDLHELGLKNLDYIAVTHIHLDHAGGAGFLVEKFKDSKIIAHRKGAYHLTEPTKLEESAEDAIGEPFEHYGKMKPIPPEKILTVSKEKEFDLGSGYKLKGIDSPGHAPHHLCFYETETQSLLTGDAAGMYLMENKELIPTTPPPNFDLEESLETLNMLQTLEAKRLLYTHNGYSNKPRENLSKYAKILKDWVREIAELQNLEEEKFYSRIAERKISEMKIPESEIPFFKEIIKMNVRGALLYLKRKGYNT